MFVRRPYATLNQENYKKHANIHNQINLDSTLYLAYRDIPNLLEKYLFCHNKNEPYNMLDFGCGVGFSTEIITKMILSAGYKVNVTGFDISEENLKIARIRLPIAKFIKIKSNEVFLQGSKKFDLIICNFVLVENQQKDMIGILKTLNSLLSNDGIILITNCSSKAYKHSNKWISLNNDFPENKSIEPNSKLKEDQPVKMQVLTGSNQFTFFDFFHSGKAYRNAYEMANLKLLETHKPIGHHSDGISWKSENEYSPYKIHILSNNQPEFKHTIKAKL